VFLAFLKNNNVSSVITVISKPKKLYIIKETINASSIFQNLLNLKSISQTPYILIRRNLFLLVYHNLYKLKPYLEHQVYHQACMLFGCALF
jgi:hypothetical protein